MANMSELSGDLLDHVADGVYYVDLSRRILRWNKAAERITGFTSGEVTGRCCSENILTHIDDQGKCLCRGECPLAHTMADGKEREAVVHLHHKDGRRIAVKVGVQPVRDEQGKIVGAVETFRECADVIAMQSTIEWLKQWGRVDLHTGLPNRKIAESQLEQRVQELRRFGWPFAVLLAEVDFISQLREKLGAEAADVALRMAGSSVLNSLRSLDMVARWDDATFIAIIANATITELAEIAERVRMMVDNSYRQTDEGEVHVTVSVGAAAADRRDSAESVVQKAQRSLYESRASGRNRVRVFGVPGTEQAHPR